MLENLSGISSIPHIRNNWKVLAGVSALLVATIGIIAKRLLAKAPVPVEKPMVFYEYPGPFTVKTPFSPPIDLPDSMSGIAGLY